MAVLGELTLGYPWPGDLTLGRTTDPGIPDNELAITITLPAPIANFQFFQGARLRKTVSVTHQTATQMQTDASISWGTAQPQTRPISAPWQAGQPQAQRLSLPWIDAVRQSVALGAPWQAGQPQSSSVSMSWKPAIQQSCAVSLPWDAAIPSIRLSALLWNEGQPQIVRLTSPWQIGQPIRRVVSAPYQIAIVLRRLAALRYQEARRPPHGWRNVLVYGGATPKHIGELNLTCPWPGELTLGRACFGSARFLVPIQRRYRVLNSATLIRVSDEADLACSNITVKLSLDDWCWTLSATLLARPAYDTVPAYSGLVRATLNGFPWDFIVDDLRYRRILGDFAPTLTGRSPIAAIAAPYASSKDYREGSLHTAAQLALQELPVGWTLDWQLPDWTVAAGIWQYQGLTPLEAITRVIKAAGGRIQPDPQALVITAVPKWPQKPWAWTGWLPDASLPASYTLEESLQPVSGAEYEGILVSGGANGGIAALIKRTGTAGAWVAPAVVETLITDSAPAEARGVQTLADAWPMKRYTLDLPLQAAPAGAGLILPGTTFDFVDGGDGWRGLVISTSITATFNSIIQTLEVVSP